MCRVLLILGLLIGFSRAADVASFAVVVHPSNPITGLRLRDLQAMFGGVTKQWKHGPKVVLIERQPESPSFRFLMGRVLNTSASEYKRNLASIEFKGETPVTVKILNSEATACKYMFYVPGAIALVEMSSLSTPECSQLKVVRVDGKLPAEDGYRLR
jgi:hypothetical protein